MFLRMFTLDLPPQETNHYILADEDSRIGILVDAGGLREDMVQTIESQSIQVRHILLTHLHWDHADALGEYVKHWPQAQVWLPAPHEAALDARIVAEGDEVDAGPFKFEVFETSGHTPESISFHCPEHGICFVGDALFAGAVGGTTSDELFERQKQHILDKLIALPESTEVLPGHGPITTVRIEKQANPFLRPSFTRTA